MEYTREKLIEICESAIVPQSQWDDRDSASAQEGVGKVLVFLRAGCDFEVKTKENTKGDCITNENTIWIQFWVKDFRWFEWGNEDGWDRPRKDGKIGNDNHDYHFYLPTEKRLESADGGDWY